MPFARLSGISYRTMPRSNQLPSLAATSTGRFGLSPVRQSRLKMSKFASSADASESGSSFTITYP